MTSPPLERVYTPTQTDFTAFAALSGDDNPIHVDPAFAAASAFARTVAHGAMLTALLRGLAGPHVAGAKIARQSAMFPAPAYADEALRLRLRCGRAAAGPLLPAGIAEVPPLRSSCRGGSRE